MPRCKWSTHVQPRLAEVEEWAGKGLTDEQIARCLGVARTSFLAYKQDHPDLMDALIRGRSSSVTEVRGLLLARARGWEYTETDETYAYDTDEEGNLVERLVQRRVMHKVAVPDVRAMANYLRSYDPEWCDTDAHSRAMREREVALKEKSQEWTEY